MFAPVLAFLASGAMQAEPVSSAAPSVSLAPVKEKKICRSEEVTGSIMPRQVCHTQAEWQRLKEAQQAELQRLHERKDNDRSFQGVQQRRN